MRCHLKGSIYTWTSLNTFFPICYGMRTVKQMFYKCRLWNGIIGTLDTSTNRENTESIQTSTSDSVCCIFPKTWQWSQKCHRI